MGRFGNGERRDWGGRRKASKVRLIVDVLYA